MRLFRNHVFAILASLALSTAATRSGDESESLHALMARSELNDFRRALVPRGGSGEEREEAGRKDYARLRTKMLLEGLEANRQWGPGKLAGKAGVFREIFRWDAEHERRGGTRSREAGDVRYRSLDDRILQVLVARRDPEPYLRAFERALDGHPAPERAARARAMRDRVAAVRASARDLGPDRSTALAEVRAQIARLRTDHKKAKEHLYQGRRRWVKDRETKVGNAEAQLNEWAERIRHLGFVEAALQLVEVPSRLPASRPRVEGEAASRREGSEVGRSSRRRRD